MENDIHFWKFIKDYESLNWFKPDLKKGDIFCPHYSVKIASPTTKTDYHAFDKFGPAFSLRLKIQLWTERGLIAPLEKWELKKMYPHLDQSMKRSYETYFTELGICNPATFKFAWRDSNEYDLEFNTEVWAKSSNIGFQYIANAILNDELIAKNSVIYFFKSQYRDFPDEFEFPLKWKFMTSPEKKALKRWPPKYTTYRIGKLNDGINELV